MSHVDWVKIGLVEKFRGRPADNTKVYKRMSTAFNLAKHRKFNVAKFENCQVTKMDLELCFGATALNKTCLTYVLILPDIKPSLV